MDITRTAQILTVVGAGQARSVGTLVIVDQGGEPLPLSAARMDGLSFISTRDSIGPRVGRTAAGGPSRQADED